MVLSVKFRLLDRAAFYDDVARCFSDACRCRKSTDYDVRTLIESSVAYAPGIYFHLPRRPANASPRRRRRGRACARMKNGDGHYSRIGEAVWRLPWRGSGGVGGGGAINKVGLWRKKGEKTKQVKR